MPVPLIFEKGSEGRCGVSFEKLDVPEKKWEEMIPARFLRRQAPKLPQVSEPDVIRHFVNLSTLNHHVDKGFYPLGSCTMKYNPKVNEDMARLPEFVSLHPAQPEKTVQGALNLMFDLGRYLCETAGFAGITLQPAAGAHGELTGLLLIRAYHDAQGKKRKTVLIPDSAHGTNPASVTISGYEAQTIASTSSGTVDLDSLAKHVSDETAALMLTNPNTLGIFESDILEIINMVHKAGALVYMDGANMNALLGRVRPGDLGIDVMHFNLHKTFSTPHGGGGPGSGPVEVAEKLLPFLPYPVVKQHKSGYRLDNNRDQSIGKVGTFFGQFGVMVRAYTYIRMLGARGLCKVSENAILNANYLLSQLRHEFDLPFTKTPMHEFVLSGDRQKKHGVRTLDIAKRLLDFGVHAPTVYFPLIVSEALMIEPTETESKDTLDRFAEIMIHIAQEARENPEILKNAPTQTPVSRLNEAVAARDLDVRYPFS